MKGNLLQALQNADAEVSAMNQVTIDSELMSHISGGDANNTVSSGDYCTISGECNYSRTSCAGFWNFLSHLFRGDALSP